MRGHLLLYGHIGTLPGQWSHWVRISFSCTNTDWFPHYGRVEKVCIFSGWLDLIVTRRWHFHVWLSLLLAKFLGPRRFSMGSKSLMYFQRFHGFPSRKYYFWSPTCRLSSFFLKILLEWSWFTMFWWFLLYSKVSLSSTHIWPHFVRFYSYGGHYRVLSRVSCALE